MADRAGCAVVGLAHFNKLVSSDPLNLITGSRAFDETADVIRAARHRHDVAGLRVDERLVDRDIGTAFGSFGSRPES